MDHPREIQALKLRLDEGDRQFARLQKTLDEMNKCLGEYKPFMDALIQREEQNRKLREVLIERGLTATMLAVGAAACSAAWYAFKAWMATFGRL